MYKRDAILSIVISLTLLLTGFSSAAFNPATVEVVDALDWQGFHLISEREGWVVVDQHLYWTETGGQSWDDITPSDTDGAAIRAVAFLDTQHGWLILTDLDKSGFATYRMARTFDGGDTWQTVPLSLFELGSVDSFASAVYIHFINAQTGWLVVKRATSSNFSAGSLFKTTDGGITWTRFTIPIGEPVTFITSEIGWTAGGAAGDEIYRTTDGGRTWKSQVFHSSVAGASLSYHLPAFVNARIGVLPVLRRADNASQLDLYITKDAGETWYLRTSTPLRGAIDSATPIVLSVFRDGSASVFLSGHPHLLQTERFKFRPLSVDFKLPANINEVEMVTSEVGWAKSMSGSCEFSLQDGTRHCSLRTALLATGDGGRTWTPLTLPRTDASTTTWRLSEKKGSSVRRVSGHTQIIQGQGFDTCEIPTLANLSTWSSASPYDAVNLYFGGSCRGCANSALTNAYVSQMRDQGWVFIPTWVGPQSACWGGICGARISNDAGTAYDQGISEANAAIDAAIALGLANSDGSGTVIYYDLEGYDTTNVACRNAAKSFISGWTAQIHAKGSQAGVYGSACAAALNDFAGIDNVPDVIWPAHWIYSAYNSAASVWSVACIPDGHWSNHQRIRQYTGGHVETWGGVTINIDCNAIDGVVVGESRDEIAPIIKFSPLTNGRWYNTDSTISWTITDEGSGVDYFKWAWDDDTPDTRVDGDRGATTLSAAAQGQHTLYVQAWDGAGNKTLASHGWFGYDTVEPDAPLISPACNAIDDQWQNTCRDTAFTWRATDPNGADGSGVVQYAYVWTPSATADPSDWGEVTDYDPDPITDTDGVAQYYLHVKARDGAGNISAVRTFGLWYDGSAPTGTITIDDGAATTNQTSVRVGLAFGDTGSGVSEVRLSYNMFHWSDWQPYEAEVIAAIPALDRRELPVYAQARDRAGNLSAVVSDTITLDLYPPMPHSANYRICDNVINGGGTVGLTSASFSLVSAIGQPEAGSTASSSSFAERGGFLANMRGCQPISHTVTDNFDIKSWVIASGGNLRGSASYQLGDTAGQPAASGANAFSSTTYVLSSGFWGLNRSVNQPGVTLSEDITRTAVPGETVMHLHIVTNTGVVSDTLSVSATSGDGWPVTLQSDGYHEGSARLPLGLEAGAYVTFAVHTTVPVNAQDGVVAQVQVTATSSLDRNIHATAIDVIRVLHSCRRPLTEVDMIGPVTGLVNTRLTFTADITPVDASQPITYTWSPEPDSGQDSATAEYEWATPDTYTLTLTAENCGGSFGATHRITIADTQRYVYLPLVLRSH